MVLNQCALILPGPKSACLILMDFSSTCSPMSYPGNERFSSLRGLSTLFSPTLDGQNCTPVLITAFISFRPSVTLAPTTKAPLQRSTPIIQTGQKPHSFSSAHSSIPFLFFLRLCTCQHIFPRRESCGALFLRDNPPETVAQPKVALDRCCVTQTARRHSIVSSARESTDRGLVTVVIPC